MNELHITFDGRGYSFQPGYTVRIGRSSENNIVVSDPTVSRQHAQLTWGPDGWVFENLGHARAFQRGQDVTRVVVSQLMELSLASPQGPVVRIQPAAPFGPQAAPAVGLQAPRLGDAPAAHARGPQEGLGYGFSPPGGASPETGRAAAPSKDDFAMAFEILVPVKSWLKDPGWRQGLRLLVIVYALLPVVFVALFSSSGNLSTPGFAYSLYVAPLWVIAFWLLLHPGKLRAVEIQVGVGIIVWVAIWLNIVTGNINSQLANAVDNGNILAALAVGYNEEIAKALPVFLAALILLKYRSVKLDVRMWMFLGTISGLTFGVLEERAYTQHAIVQVATANAVPQADAGVLDFALRVFVDGFQHAIWAGVSAFFIGMAVNYPRRRWQLIFFGVSIAAVLHALNDWSLTFFHSFWPWIFIQAVSLLLFLGYTMSATTIERQVRRTPLFRGESIVTDMNSLPGSEETGGS